MSFKCCIFDFDGTLVDSLADILDSLAVAFERSGIAAPPLDVPTIMQLQLRDSIAVSAPRLSSAEIDGVVREFTAAYDASGFPKTALMKGVARLLPELEKRGVGRYIASNKRRTPTIMILDKFNIRGRFDGIYNPDMYPGGRRMTKSELIAHLLDSFSLPPESAVYVGDAEVDVEAAKANGLFVAIVEQGYGRIEHFKTQPDRILTEITDILAVCG